MSQNKGKIYFPRSQRVYKTTLSENSHEKPVTKKLLMIIPTVLNIGTPVQCLPPQRQSGFHSSQDFFQEFKTYLTKVWDSLGYEIVVGVFEDGSFKQKTQLRHNYTGCPPQKFDVK